MRPRPQTELEILDRVTSHLLAQGEHSRDNRGKFAYRGERGLKCAIGILIPDGDYDPSMEGKEIDLLIEEYPQCAWMGPYQKLLNMLQTIHDRYHVEYWGKELHDLRRDMQERA